MCGDTMATSALRHAQVDPQPCRTSGVLSDEIIGMEPNPLCPDLPIFDLGTYLTDPSACQPLCQALAACLHTASAVVVRDPRVDEDASEAFLDQMEAYFDQPREAKLPDVRADLAYQVGATPDGTERPRCLADSAILRQAEAELGEEDRPTPPQGPDSKWRFFWRLGERPAETRFRGEHRGTLAVGGTLAAGERWRQGDAGGRTRGRARGLLLGCGFSPHALPCPCPPPAPPPFPKRESAYTHELAALQN